MSTVHEIIDAFGGVNAASKECGVPQQTVSEWYNRAPPEIPPWRRPVLAMRAAGLRLTLSDDAREYLASQKRTPKSPASPEQAVSL